MNEAMPHRSTAWTVGSVHAPFLPVARGCFVERDEVPEVDDVPFLHSALCQRVFTAAGEVEAAEWVLDGTLADAGASDGEIGVGLDVAPVDGALESARWALDQAVDALHAEIAAAARRGVPVPLLAEASGLDAEELGSVLDAAGAAGDTPQKELAPAG